MKKILVLAAVIALAAINLKSIVIFFHTTTHEIEKVEIDAQPAQLWVEIHDVSPGYGYGKLEEILNVLEKYPSNYLKVVLFVIPNHGNAAPLHKYPEFAGKLKKLEEKGYLLGVHGYAHEEPLKKFEFDCDAEQAERMLSAARYEFEASNLRFPSYFAAPGWRTSYEVNEHLRKNFGYVYYYYYIDTPDGTLPHHSNEYTWYNFDRGGVRQAVQDYSSAKGVFRLTLHVGAVNERGLRFLEEFLIEKNNIAGYGK
ncbi:MAG: DUF2334 domain-containing protein [Euryarchaeota archaeon]|nr:DUF2334 domain-containing protein [Euryarchaeota archaeon]